MLIYYTTQEINAKRASDPDNENLFKYARGAKNNKMSDYNKRGVISSVLGYSLIDWRKLWLWAFRLSRETNLGMT